MSVITRLACLNVYIFYFLCYIYFYKGREVKLPEHLLHSLCRPDRLYFHEYLPIDEETRVSDLILTGSESGSNLSAGSRKEKNGFGSPVQTTLSFKLFIYDDFQLEIVAILIFGCPYSEVFIKN